MNWRACTMLGALLLVMGCQSHTRIVRAAPAARLVQALHDAAGDKTQYTFRWLRRSQADTSTHSRFDGVVVDLRGRQITPVRRQAGDHILHLHANTQQPANTLTMSGQELPTLQAVVRQYRFVPYVITDHAGVPQVIVYAPVPTLIALTQTPHEHTWRLEVHRANRQPNRGNLGPLHASSPGTW